MANQIEKPVKAVVVAFRITEAEEEKLQTIFDSTPMVGIKSTRQLARKLALDWANGKLAYKSKEDMLVSSEISAAEMPAASKRRA